MAKKSKNAIISVAGLQSRAACDTGIKFFKKALDLFGFEEDDEVDLNDDKHIGFAKHLLVEYAFWIAENYTLKPSVLGEALAINGFIIKTVKRPTEDMKLISVKNKAFSLGYIKNPSINVILAAINTDPYVICDVENPSELMIFLALHKDGLTLKLMKNPTEEMIFVALNSNGLALKYVENPTKAMIMTALHNLSERLHT